MMEKADYAGVSAFLFLIERVTGAGNAGGEFFDVRRLLGVFINVQGVMETFQGFFKVRAAGAVLAEVIVNAADVFLSFAPF